MISFKYFLENQKMDPWQAMNVLGVTHLAGQDFNSHENEIKTKYRQMAMDNHPDRNPGEPEEVANKFKAAAEAWDSLQDFKDRTLPSGENTGFFNRNVKKNYSLEDVQNFVQQIFQHKFTDYFVRTPYQGYDIMGRTGYMPYGSKARKNKIPPESTPEQMVQGFQRMVPGFPGTIIDLTVTDREAWITWRDQQDLNKYQSVSFEPPGVKKAKEKGVGMKVDQVIEYLNSQGLQYLGGGHKNSYYGFEEAGEGYFIRLKAKTIRLIRRMRIYSGLEDKGVTDEMYFGQLTPQLLDQLIAILKKKTGHTT
jgi:curved DNA-binding protein CbpA